jgi:hypothetical protein
MMACRRLPDDGMKRAGRRECELPASGCCNETGVVIGLNPVSGSGGRTAWCTAAAKDLDNDHPAAAARARRAMIGRGVQIGGVVRCRRINRHRGGDQLSGVCKYWTYNRRWPAARSGGCDVCHFIVFDSAA